MRLCLLIALAFCALSAQAETWRFVTEDFPPFTYPREGQRVALDGPSAEGAGPFVEIIERACQRLEQACRVEVLPWRRALNLAEEGQVEGIFTVIDNPERQHYFHISRMLVAARYSLFTEQDSALAYRQAADLKGYHVGVYGPSGTALILESLLKQVDDATLEMETDNPRVLRKLAAGRYGPRGAILMNRDVALYLKAQLQLENVREAGTVQSIQYGIGLSRALVSRDTFEAFDRALRELQRRGEVASILARYGLEPAAPQK